MLNRIVAIVLATLFAVPAISVAQERPIAKSIDAAVARELQRPAARGENPNRMPALALMAGGAALTIIAVAYPTGAKCESGINTFSCGTTMNKGLLFAGLGAAGLGAFLFIRGESQRGLPSITATPGGVAVGYTVKF